jgi:uncharacterized membrane protein HdeD (DUF308 family)
LDAVPGTVHAGWAATQRKPEEEEGSMAQVKARTQTMPWWLFLITGIAWLLIAMVVLRFNISSITTVGILLGALFLAAAINEFFVSAVVDTWRWAHILLGILFVFGALWGFLQPKEAFWALASVLGLLLVLQGSMTLIASVMAKGPLWGLGMAVGILEILLGFWASQQYYAPRATLILVWVGFMALFRGIGEIVFAFELRRAEG